MMTTFTDWDILRNLLLAARWTIALSLVAFLGGTLVTLPLLFLRLLKRKWLTRVIRAYTELFQGTPLLMQLFLAFFGVGLFGIDVAPWTAASLALTFLYQRVSAGYLARQYSGAAQGPVGSITLPRARFWSDADASHRTPGDSHCDCSYGGICGAGD